MAHYTLRAKASDAAHLGILGANRRQEHWPVVLLHDIFGPLPFRPAAIDPAVLAWNGATVKRLAETVYEERASNRLPILADVLEDAGCTDPDILDHCRSGGPHVRGCWVVDLVLSKS